MVENEINSLVKFIKITVGDGFKNHQVDCDGVDIVTIDRASLVDLLKKLRDDSSMNFKHLSWMTAVDYPKDVNRFHVSYDLRNHDNFQRIRIKIAVDDDDAWVPSVTGLYPTANWHEREMMELFGIEVRDHPDPRKLLLPDWVVEHPLRKDFPHGGEELWAFHRKTIEMFNERNEYQGDLNDPWLEKFDE